MGANAKGKAKTAAFSWASRVFLLLVTVLTLFPVLWNIYSSFKTNSEFSGNPFALPKSFAIDNYTRVLQNPNLHIPLNFANSLLIVAVLLVVLVACVVPCSYALARYKFFGSRVMETLYMAAIFIQPTYIMLPLFLQMSSINMTERLLPLGVLYAVTQFPFSIFLMTGFMRAIPRDYEEAAMIDGCGNFRILTQVIAPMAKPGIVTVCMLSAMAGWNEYPIALVMLTDSVKQTLPVGIASLYQVQKQATDWGGLFAALVIVLIPTIALYAFGQKYLIQGISAGGIKG